MDAVIAKVYQELKSAQRSYGISSSLVIVIVLFPFIISFLYSPYGIALFIFLAAYLKFIIKLPAKTRLLIVGAGCIYVTGAIGFELLSGHHSVLYGKENLMYIVLSTTEEVFEMGGIVVFVYALLSYISSEYKDLRIRVASEWI